MVCRSVCGSRRQRNASTPHSRNILQRTNSVCVDRDVRRAQRKADPRSGHGLRRGFSDPHGQFDLPAPPRRSADCPIRAGMGLGCQRVGAGRAERHDPRDQRLSVCAERRPSRQCAHAVCNDDDASSAAAAMHRFQSLHEADRNFPMAAQGGCRSIRSTRSHPAALNRWCRGAQIALLQTMPRTISTGGRGRLETVRRLDAVTHRTNSGCSSTNMPNHGAESNMMRSLNSRASDLAVAAARRASPSGTICRNADRAASAGCGAREECLESSEDLRRLRGDRAQAGAGGDGCRHGRAERPGVRSAAEACRHE